jgi:hypothetical protein
VNYQFSTGKQRSLYVEDEDDLYDATYPLFEDLFDKGRPVCSVADGWRLP